ncbi:MULTISPECIES: cupin domain-containing protein [unclassified Sedimentibacter]|uniref:cupin domain-containing protein n=1 Tax=unclassified Sedimentibacter TaxID=2649220 RepID=UPI0027E10198|nr:cupin domain-containing protein [Sedimentibacter sp. MB35-C1]WMJ76952.1 cupin domain-containing protein [Sedimentibacter sp. MB35-C1]
MARIESGNWNKLPWQEVREGISRVVFGTGVDNISCTINKVDNGNEVRPHSHPNEQIALVVKGECDYYVDGKAYRLTPGSWVSVPANIEHYIHVYDSPVPCMQMDIFFPVRPEYTVSYSNFIAELKNKNEE